MTLSLLIGLKGLHFNAPLTAEEALGEFSAVCTCVGVLSIR